MPTINDPSAPGTRLGREFKNAAEGSKASAKELHDFIQSMRGRSPQEVLGAVANSGLAQGIGVSAVGTILLFVLFSAVPYLIYGPPQVKPKAAPEKIVVQPTADPKSNESVATKNTESDSSKSADNANAAQGADGAVNPTRALEKLGESETKNADPNVNPLENGLDDLLDGKK